MIISNIAVKRPVFAIVISLLLALLGLMAFMQLPVREYPDIDPPIVSVSLDYRGASAEIVEKKVTQQIEDAVAGIEGIEKMTSSTEDGESRVTLEFSLDRDVNAAANDVRDRVSRIVDNLPEEADPPEIQKADSDTDSVIWLSLTSDRMNTLQLTDYADRVLVDRFSTVPGVASVRIGGDRQYAMRIWLDRQTLAGHGLTVTDIESVLRAENVELPAGRLESTQREFMLRTSTGMDSAEDFRELVIGRGENGQLVRLGDIARVELAAASERSLTRSNGKATVSLGISQQSKANTVELSEGVRAEMRVIEETLPEGMEINVNYDRAEFINESINEVFIALGVSLVLVLVVIYAFLGTLRATLIPAVVIPVSLLASFIIVQPLGYSINVLMLLGLVLAIGLIVDDAIIVLENIYRRIEEGQPPLLAALDGSREIGFAVIATTTVLVSVFVPISFMQGNIGRLFSEFGISVAAAVAFSCLVALTLTPMMTSQLFKAESERGRFAAWLDGLFARFSAAYERSLRRQIEKPWRMVVLTLLVIGGAVALFAILPTEYSPREDRGVYYVVVEAPLGASMEYTERYADIMEDVIMEQVEAGYVDRVQIRIPGSWSGGLNSARALALLAHWDERDKSAAEIAAETREKLAGLPGVSVRVSTPAGLGVRGGSDRPVSVVLGGNSYDTLEKRRDELLAWMERNPMFIGADSDYEERKPQMNIHVDRDRAAALGVSLTSVGRTLETMLGSRVVTTFQREGEEYDVILQAEPSDRASPSDIFNIYVRSDTSGELVSLGNLVTITEEAGPLELNRFDRLRAISVSAGLAEGYSLGQGLAAIEDYVAANMPDVTLGYDGESREFKQSGKSLYFTFVVALIVVYLVLAAQFESFRHPLVIMFTVPLAITGALIGLWLFGVSINVFSQIGMILLIGLAAKNGVLIVEFANQLRDRGVEFTEAIVHAAGVRLRPVLMTSFAAAFGAVPLMLATGAGSESREAIGVTIFFGVMFSTLLTLGVVPAAYALIARGTTSPEHIARRIRRMREEERPAAENS
ncbi:MAG TPA: efflux RND transporter permease subunit [Gammaproteobacteria bacterium]